MNSLVEIEQSILPWLGRSMKLIDYHIADCFEAKGILLTKVQLIALLILSKQNGQPQQSLAILTNRDKASLARLLTVMERKELVIRKADEHDRRIKHVFITPFGKDTLTKALPVLQNVITTIQEGIDKEEIEIATSVLKKILSNIKSATAENS